MRQVGTTLSLSINATSDQESIIAFELQRLTSGLSEDAYLQYFFDQQVDQTKSSHRQAAAQKLTAVGGVATLTAYEKGLLGLT